MLEVDKCRMLGHVRQHVRREAWIEGNASVMQFSKNTWGCRHIYGLGGCERADVSHTGDSVAVVQRAGRGSAGGGYIGTHCAVAWNWGGRGCLLGLTCGD